jgi:hypothetical protein
LFLTKKALSYNSKDAVFISASTSEAEISCSEEFTKCYLLHNIFTKTE